MTNRNQIWKKANESSDAKCIQILRTIFPSLSYDFIVGESGVERTTVDTKKAALEKIRTGLKGITEVEAAYYLSILGQKRRTSQIKY